jgi:hypothetical protein
MQQVQRIGITRIGGIYELSNDAINLHPYLRIGGGGSARGGLA